MLFPLFKSWFASLFGTVLGSSQKEYKTPTGFQTIGGGGGGDSRSNRRNRRTLGSKSNNSITVNPFSESEEHMVDDVNLQTFNVFATSTPDEPPSNGILVSNQVHVTREETSVAGPYQSHQRVHGNW